jgi:hypothetical protein
LSTSITRASALFAASRAAKPARFHAHRRRPAHPARCPSASTRFIHSRRLSRYTCRAHVPTQPAAVSSGCPPATRSPREAEAGIRQSGKMKFDGRDGNGVHPQLNIQTALCIRADDTLATHSHLSARNPPLLSCNRRRFERECTRWMLPTRRRSRDHHLQPRPASTRTADHARVCSPVILRIRPHPVDAARGHIARVLWRPQRDSACRAIAVPLSFLGLPGTVAWLFLKAASHTEAAPPSVRRGPRSFAAKSSKKSQERTVNSRFLRPLLATFTSVRSLLLALSFFEESAPTGSG